MKYSILFVSIFLTMSTFSAATEDPPPSSKPVRAAEKEVPPPYSALSSIPVGAMLPFAGHVEPEGGEWLLCNGQLLNRVIYRKLYETIGIAYGAGNGVDTFNIPDARGRSLFGNDSMGGRPAGRLTASSLEEGVGLGIGAHGGHESITLSEKNLPPHKHSYTTGHGESSEHKSGFPANAETGEVFQTLSTGSTGGGEPFNIMPRFLVVNWIIRVK